MFQLVHNEHNALGDRLRNFCDGPSTLAHTSHHCRKFPLHLSVSNRSVVYIAYGLGCKMLDNVFNFLACQLREHGKGYHSVCCVLGGGEFSSVMSKRAEGRDQMEGSGIVHACSDPLLSQALTDMIPILEANYE